MTKPPLEQTCFLYLSDFLLFEKKKKQLFSIRKYQTFLILSIIEKSIDNE